MTDSQIKAFVSRIIREKCCCGQGIPTTSGMPTFNGSDSDNVRLDPIAGIIWYWDGDSWESFTVTVDVEQGLSIGSPIKLGDDAAGTGEMGVLTSTRYINQDEHPVIFVADDVVGVTNVEMAANGNVILRSTDAGTAESAYLQFNARHNNVGGWNAFISRFPGNTSLPANNTVIPFVEHATHGDDGTGFNEAPQADYIYIFGINIADSPNFDNRIGGVGISMESYYDGLDDTTGRQEMHFVNWKKTTGSGHRFISYQGFEDTVNLGSQISIDTGLDNTGGTAVEFKNQGGDPRITFNWNAKLATFYNGVGILFELNDTAALTQNNAANTSGIEIARVNADDNVAICQETYIFSTTEPNIFTSSGGLSLGSDTNPLSGGLIITSNTSSDLLKLKQDSVADMLIFSTDADQWFIGNTPAGQTQIMAINKAAPANSLSITVDGAIISGGATSPYGRIVAGGVVGTISIAANGISAAGDTAFYANGGALTGDAYIFRSDMNASNKVIGLIKSHAGDVELRLSQAGLANKTAATVFEDAAGSWSIGTTRTTNSLYFYNDGDKFAGGTSVMELTKAGKIIPTLDTYADDAAAGVGGLTAGMLYKTATGEVRIKT